jgi:ribonucleoside-diphosphate reductase alpha chain
MVTTNTTLQAVSTGQNGRLGLQIARHFTIPGIHPYEQVEWEFRDAVINDWKSGKVAFEQRDVEFPKSWSANSTTIVAQKYFRGHLGAPDRERSVRQMIDRVADTITEWGHQDGYFADTESMQAFNAELKHILVNQKASFNSPVWFNLGVPGRTPQASACQPWDARVSTPDGLIPIGHLVETNAVGTKVFDGQGLTKIVAVKANGRKRVLRFHLRTGLQLDVTPDHLVWQATCQETGTFVQAGSLRPGDHLAWHRTYSSGGLGEITSTAIAEAALAGWLQSNRFIGHEAGTDRALVIETTAVTAAEREWVLDAMGKALPGHRDETFGETQDKALDCWRYRIDGRDAQEFIKRWGLRSRGIDKEVPHQLFTAPLPVAAAYLRSLFQAEGMVSTQGRAAVIILDLTAERLVRGLQSLLLRFGILPHVHVTADSQEGRPGWSLRIENLGDLLSFHDEIGFIDPSKRDELEASFVLEGPGAQPIERLKINDIEDLGMTEVYDIQTESGEYLSGNIRVHNCFILSVEDTMSSILNWYVEEGLIFKGGSGAGVNLSRIRSSYEPLAGGGTASGPVSFMRGADASAGTIKSGGTTRRAAKMVILNVDHPDIQEFIWCKQREELKARALGAAGFDMDLDGRDSASIQYQNANNSVRVTDEFMQAVLADKDFALRSVLAGQPVKTVRARDLLREIAQAAWECADPGMQYDTTINEWHTCPNAGRINGSNPCCFAGEVFVETAAGPMRFDVLEKMSVAGEALPDVCAYDRDHNAPVWKPIHHVWTAGTTDELVHVTTARGLALRCTPEHRFLTDQGYVPASELRRGATLVAVDAAGGAREVDTVADVEEVRLDLPVAVYDLEVGELHNFVVTGDGPTVAHGIVVHNSEYMHLDNSACNLASLNLRKFEAHGVFDVEAFRHAVEIMFTAQEIIVGHSSYPTDKIAANAKAYRQLGLGYANLGGLLMSQGLAYDSEEGRAWASAITALMTGHAYRTSAQIARVTGPFEGYGKDRDGMLRVLHKHRAALDEIDANLAPDDVLAAARLSWDEAVDLATAHGVRNAQASVLAPTGCLAGGSLVATDRGLVRLTSLGDPCGAQWQKLDTQVATDEDPQAATKFYVNGLESVVAVETSRGYRIEGTPAHRIKIVTPDGRWQWKRLADLKQGDLVPLLRDQLIGGPQHVRLPSLVEDHAVAPASMTPEVAELIGYFMGNGSLHRGGIRLLVDETDFEVVDHLARLGKALFGLEAQVSQRSGHAEIVFTSDGLARWWEACGFASAPSIPDAVLHSNDRAVYAAFLRGLFEAAATVVAGEPRLSTQSVSFSHDVQSLLLALGHPTTRERDSGGDGHAAPVILRLELSTRWVRDIGFLSDRKKAAVARQNLWWADDCECRFLYDTVATTQLGSDELTYDLSVPATLTYIANGFVSHNTIGLMMDCDTTGIEPDLGLVKSKKLVGGGTMRIVNQTVPAALVRLGYQTEQIEAIVAYIDEHATIEGAPAFKPKHLPVFDCAMGERSISPMGHVKMMAAVQPWISGAISKTVNLPESATVEDVEQVYIEGWKLGLKALAIYRDNCKVAQPLSLASKKEKANATEQAAAEAGIVRRRLPKQRPSQTISFQVGDAEGYLTAGEYPGDGLGEIFVKLGKQGSTLAGVMDAFAISVSIGLQYGVPLEIYVRKFTNMRFEPAGMTDDPEVRFATSIVDYLFRRLAIEYLPAEKRQELGIYTIGERNALAAGTHSHPPAAPADATGQSVLEVDRSTPVDDTHGDAPMCYQCGVAMIRAGSCHCCPQCGSTSGCS